jgi:hypothetical protein
MTSLSIFTSGAFMMGCAIAALFFYRFWKETADRLFATFAFAFGMMALERIPLVFFHPAKEHEVYVYLIRLVAFCLLIYAIVDKNRQSRNTNA